MNKLTTAMTTAAAMLTATVTPGCQPVAPQPVYSTIPAEPTHMDDVAGTWTGGKCDPGACYQIILELRADGTYTKQLKTNIGVGGAHSGTYRVRGTVVYLSGDGNWPPYSHDLSQFQKVQ